MIDVCLQKQSLYTHSYALANWLCVCVCDVDVQCCTYSVMHIVQPGLTHIAICPKYSRTVFLMDIHRI